MIIELRTWRSADQVRAHGTKLMWRIDPSEVGRYHVGDRVTVTSADGRKFTGRVSDANDRNLHLHVDLS